MWPTGPSRLRDGARGIAEFPLRPKRNRRSLHYATPDFLSGLVALANFMRLSLRKAALAVIASAA